jgi:hypothetical protein
MNRLKLFVVGENSSDPKEWGSKHAFVIAPDAETAERMAVDLKGAIELPMSEPMVIGYEDSEWTD